MRKRLYPPNVTSFKDRHGRERLRYRKTGQPAYYFKHRFGTAEFAAELDACKKGEPLPAVPIGQSRIRPGTVNDLISRYYRSGTFNSGGATTQEKNRGIFEGFRALCGNDMVRDFKFQHLDAIITEKAKRYPSAARNLRKQLRRLFEYAVKIEMRSDNPVEKTDRVKVKTKGHHTWTEDEIAAYQARHPIGTMPRLALELMLWTAARKGDATKLGIANVEDGFLTYVQDKTGKTIKLPVAEDLRRAIIAIPAMPDVPTFLRTSFGKPFTVDGFGGYFRRQCDAAGLKHCSAHGLRKAISRRLAEIGMSNQAIKAITGHSGDAEVALYTRGVEQAKLARDSMGALENWANPQNGVAKTRAETRRNLQKGVDSGGPGR